MFFNLNQKNKQIVLLLLMLHVWGIKSQIPVGDDIIGPINGQLGWAVAMNTEGSRFVVSAPQYANNIDDEGVVQIYELINGNWIQLGNDIYGLSAYEQSGMALDINSEGTRIIIGSHRGSININHQGHTRIFEWNGTTWQQMGTTIFGESSQVYSGSSVSMNGEGNRIAIGTYTNKVRTFEWSGNEWIQMGPLLQGDIEHDNFGHATSFNNLGNRLVISSPGHDTPINNAGQLKTFEWSGSEWIQLGSDIYGTFEGFSLGVALDINDEGNRITASGQDYYGTGLGHIQTFEWDGVQWQQLGSDIIADVTGDLFGRALSLNGIGNRVVVGAHESDDNGIDSGLVRIFDYIGNDWIQYGEDIYGDFAYDIFGYSVSLNNAGTRLAVGARGYNNGAGFGLLRVFDLPLLGMEDIATFKNNISIYPNPVEEFVSINNLNNLNISFAMLYDSNGKMLQLFDIKDSSKTIDLNISKLPTGIYTLVIYVLNKKASYQLIKK